MVRQKLMHVITYCGVGKVISFNATYVGYTFSTFQEFARAYHPELKDIRSHIALATHTCKLQQSRLDQIQMAHKVSMDTKRNGARALCYQI